jgi:hypothetical protein
MNMEAEAKNVSSENGAPGFRKCSYPYCRNMALPTVDYCEMHRHSTLLNKHPRLKNPVKKMIAAPKTKVSKKVKKIAAEILKKAMTPPLVTIVLTADEALTAGVALALADLINADRFKDADKISGKILRAIVKQIPQHDIEEAS